MLTFDSWLATRGPGFAMVLESQREKICDSVASRLASAFPTLCYDPNRPDALEFQQLTYSQTPRRFHRLIQVVLLLQSLEVIEREYRWGWPILQRYGVGRQHLLSQVHWYFEGSHALAAPDPVDVPYLEALEGKVLQMIEQITVVALPAYAPVEGIIRTNGHRNGHTPGAH
jgi:hypothetical protein